MRYSLTAILMTIGLVAAQPASAAQDAPGTVVRDGDGALTCMQMADEAATLSADMGVNGPGLLGRVGEVARMGATFVPGGSLAVAGADALTAPGRDRKEAETQTNRDRWNYLNGLFAGRGCDEVATPAAVSTEPPTGEQTGERTAPPTPAQTAPRITPARLPN